MAQKKIITSVITGDIVQSRSSRNSVWLPRLKKALSYEGTSPKTWQIYRGDSFQLEVKDPEMVLRAAIRIKAAVKTVKKLDVRMSIGIGEKTYGSQRVVESDGEAFVRSGETFELLKKMRTTLAIRTGWAEFDRDMDVFLRLACIPMDNWSRSSAELVTLLLNQKNLTQKAIAKKLGITQPSISERRNRSHFDEIMALEELFRDKLRTLTGTK